MSEVLARLSGVTRRFGSVVALDGADLALRSGEVHGVLGANGAGKTTLLSVLGGMLRPDEGTVEVGGAPVRLTSPRDAWAHGVALVHQHFTLVPTLTVLENLALGRRAGPGWTMDHISVRTEVGALMQRTGLVVPLDRPVEEVGVGDRQRTEILKALLRDPRVLVLDEPTAVLAPSEVEGLFSLLRELAAEGRAVALVAHKLDEVLSVADRVTVLRDGHTVLTAPRDEADAESLVRAMVGGDVAQASGSARPTVDPEGAPTVAHLAGVRRRAARGEVAVDGVDLTVRRGEIVGIAGVEGNGQRELARILAEREAPDEGVADIASGVGFIPQDRITEGVIGDFDLTENVALALQRDPRYGRGPWLDWKALAVAAEDLRERYDIAAPSVRTRVDALSGGNQQRVVVGREVGLASDLLVAENPTRGLDVEATAFVHAELRRLIGRADAPPGVVLISTDLDEVLALSDRIFAMTRGRLVPVPSDERTRAGIGARMLAGRDG